RAVDRSVTAPPTHLLALRRGLQPDPVRRPRIPLARRVLSALVLDLLLRQDPAGSRGTDRLRRDAPGDAGPGDAADRVADRPADHGVRVPQRRPAVRAG